MKRAAVLFCLLLAGCNTVEDQYDSVKDTLPKWTGQDIQVAISALGTPDTTKAVRKNTIYTWKTERPENYRILGGETVTRDGFIETPDATHFNITATCTITAAARTEDHIIIGSRMEGQMRTCAQFAEKIRGPEAALSKSDE